MEEIFYKRRVYESVYDYFRLYLKIGRNKRFQAVMG